VRTLRGAPSRIATSHPAPDRERVCEREPSPPRTRTLANANANPRDREREREREPSRPRTRTRTRTLATANANAGSANANASDCESHSEGVRASGTRGGPRPRTPGTCERRLRMRLTRRFALALAWCDRRERPGSHRDSQCEPGCESPHGGVREGRRGSRTPHPQSCLLLALGVRFALARSHRESLAGHCDSQWTRDSHPPGHGSVAIVSSPSRASGSAASARSRTGSQPSPSLSPAARHGEGQPGRRAR
jgi:hypothetical protein